MHDASAALTPADRLLAQRLRRAWQTYRRVTWAGALALSAGLCAMLAGFVWTESTRADAWIALGVLAAASVALVLGIGAKLRRRARLERPLARALADTAPKKILRAPLDHVDRLPDGLLRYVLADGRQLDLLVPLALGSRRAVLPDAPVRSMEHLRNRTVELHFLPLDVAHGLLLQAHYAGAGAVHREERAATDADHRRAQRIPTQVAWVLAGVCLVLSLAAAVVHPAAGLLLAAVSAVLTLGYLAVGWWPAHRRQRACTRLQTLTAPVTEIISARLGNGNGARFIQHWYRLDGVLVEAPASRAALGQTVRLQRLLPDPAGAGADPNVGVIVDLAAPAPGDAVDAATIPQPDGAQPRTPATG